MKKDEKIIINGEKMIMKMKLKVLHYPQIPCTPFEVKVSSIEEAVKTMKTLADYDLFQL